MLKICSAEKVGLKWRQIGTNVQKLNWMNVPFIRYENFGRSVFHFNTIHVFDRRTEISWLISPCIVSSPVKIKYGTVVVLSLFCLCHLRNAST